MVPESSGVILKPIIEFVCQCCGWLVIDEGEGSQLSPKGPLQSKEKNEELSIVLFKMSTPFCELFTTLLEISEQDANLLRSVLKSIQSLTEQESITQQLGQEFNQTANYPQYIKKLKDLIASSKGVSGTTFGVFGSMIASK